MATSTTKYLTNLAGVQLILLAALSVSCFSATAVGESFEKSLPKTSLMVQKLEGGRSTFGTYRKLFVSDQLKKLRVRVDFSGNDERFVIFFVRNEDRQIIGGKQYVLNPRFDNEYPMTINMGEIVSRAYHQRLPSGKYYLSCIVQDANKRSLGRLSYPVTIVYRK